MEFILILIVGSFAFALTVGAYFVIRDTIRRRGNWGINIRRVSCPVCGQDMPAVRRPRTIYQAFWGGWTCNQCGCEMDKWGNCVFAKNRGAAGRA